MKLYNFMKKNKKNSQKLNELNVKSKKRVEYNLNYILDIKKSIFQ